MVPSLPTPGHVEPLRKRTPGGAVVRCPAALRALIPGKGTAGDSRLKTSYAWVGSPEPLSEDRRDPGPLPWQGGQACPPPAPPQYR
jgi:hypothetical protein